MRVSSSLSCLLQAIWLVFSPSLSFCEASSPYVLTPDKSLVKTSYSSNRTSVLTPESRKIFKGWDYLALKLINDGIDPKVVTGIYSSPRMPRFSPVFFKLVPKESSSLYSRFFSTGTIKDGKECLKRYHSVFKSAQERYGIPKNILAALLLIETHCGKVTGTHRIILQLSRLASVGAPENLRKNYLRLKKDNPNTLYGDMLSRARYLEDTFYPEVKALIEIASMQKINIFNIKGSKAGAFGIPQFLPTSYIYYGVDGNGDNKVSLFTPADAIFSTANYLAVHGWRRNTPLEDNRKALWHYNKSEAYINAVIKAAGLLTEK